MTRAGSARTALEAAARLPERVQRSDFAALDAIHPEVFEARHEPC